MSFVISLPKLLGHGVRGHEGGHPICFSLLYRSIAIKRVEVMESVYVSTMGFFSPFLCLSSWVRDNEDTELVNSETTYIYIYIYFVVIQQRWSVFWPLKRRRTVFFCIRAASSLGVAKVHTYYTAISSVLKISVSTAFKKHGFYG